MTTNDRRAPGRPRFPARRAHPLALALAAPLALALACGGSAEADGELRLTLLGTTDVHGYLLPWEYARGQERDGSLAQIARLADSLRRVEPHLLLFDSGDLLQGTPLNSFRSWLARSGTTDGTAVPERHPVIAAMNAAGYAAAAIGNHEFNYGIEFLRTAIAGAEFPFLSANARTGSDGRPFFPPYTVIETGGVRVGVLGLTTPGVAVWDRRHVEGELVFEDLVEAARRFVPELRARADLVVVLAHSGLGPGSSYAESAGVPEENAVRRLAREVPGIDVIFAGHAHVAIPGERVGSVLILEAGRFAEQLAIARLTLRRDGGSWRVVEARGELLPVAGVPPAEEVVEAVLADHEATLRWLEEPIGYTPERWSAADARVRDRPIADLIAEVQRQAAGADLASTAIFDPGAGFGPGPITRREVLGLYIYPNTLRAVRLSGAELDAYLEWSARYFGTWPDGPPVNPSVPGYNYDMLSGLEYEIDLSRPPGDRVSELRRSGRSVAPTDSFTLALNSYRQAGGGGFPAVTDAPLVFSAEVEVSELLTAFIRARDTLRHADVYRENWRLVPPAAVARLLESAAVARRHRGSGDPRASGPGRPRLRLRPRTSRRSPAVRR